MKIRKVASTLMLSLVLIPGEGSGQSRELKTVRVAIIGGQVPLPIAIGQAHGFFEKFGVRVTAETMWTSGTPGRGSPRGNMTLPTLPWTTPLPPQKLPASQPSSSSAEKPPAPTS